MLKLIPNNEFLSTELTENLYSIKLRLSNWIKFLYDMWSEYKLYWYKGYMKSIRMHTLPRMGDN